MGAGAQKCEDTGEALLLLLHYESGRSKVGDYLSPFRFIEACGMVATAIYRDVGCQSLQSHAGVRKTRVKLSVAECRC